MCTDADAPAHAHASNGISDDIVLIFSLYGVRLLLFFFLLCLSSIRMILYLLMSGLHRALTIALQSEVGETNEAVLIYIELSRNSPNQAVIVGTQMCYNLIWYWNLMQNLKVHISTPNVCKHIFFIIKLTNRLMNADYQFFFFASNFRCFDNFYCRCFDKVCFECPSFKHFFFVLVHWALFCGHMSYLSFPVRCCFLINFILFLLIFVT